MSTWKDPFTTPPAPNSAIWFRRFPDVTPPLQGVWRPKEGIVTLGPDDSWSLPCDLVSRWRPPAYTIPVPDPAPLSGWRDPILWPPRPGQHGWVRRFLSNTAAFPAVWDEATHSFTLNPGGEGSLGVRWYYVWQWKPR